MRSRSRWPLVAYITIVAVAMAWSAANTRQLHTVETRVENVERTVTPCQSGTDAICEAFLRRLIRSVDIIEKSKGKPSIERLARVLQIPEPDVASPPVTPVPRRGVMPRQPDEGRGNRLGGRRR